MKKEQSTTPNKKITGQNVTGQEPVSEYVKLTVELSAEILSKLSKHLDLEAHEGNKNHLLIVASDGERLNYTMIGNGNTLTASLANLVLLNKKFKDIIYLALGMAANVANNEKDTDKLPEA